ncbi:MAG TPA: CBS domain-containing protein [Verrucomicrobiae bacterium]|jgi:CBS domain-containing protein|nr:CBS domain-containing protein [Verrucomicrobiae bacterium]
MTAKQVEELLKEKKIYQIINPRLVQASPSISIKSAVELMQQNKSGYVVIADKKKVVGLLTETEIVQKILGENINWDAPASEFMNPNPAVLNPKDPVGEAIDHMATHKSYHLPLVNEQQELVGVISVRTLIRFLASFYPQEVYNLPPKLDQIMTSQEGG